MAKESKKTQKRKNFAKICAVLLIFIISFCSTFFVFNLAKQFRASLLEESSTSFFERKDKVLDSFSEEVEIAPDVLSFLETKKAESFDLDQVFHQSFQPNQNEIIRSKIEDLLSEVASDFIQKKLKNMGGVTEFYSLQKIFKQTLEEKLEQDWGEEEKKYILDLFDQNYCVGHYPENTLGSEFCSEFSETKARLRSLPKPSSLEVLQTSEILKLQDINHDLLYTHSRRLKNKLNTVAGATVRRNFEDIVGRGDNIDDLTERLRSIIQKNPLSRQHMEEIVKAREVLKELENAGIVKYLRRKNRGKSIFNPDLVPDSLDDYLTTDTTDYTLSISRQNPGEFILKSGDTEQDEFQIKFIPQNNNPVQGDFTENKMIFKEAWDGVDLLQTTLEDGLKEDLILKNEFSEKNFFYAVELTGLVPVFNLDGSVNYVDENGFSRFYTPAPFAIDANGKKVEGRVELKPFESENTPVQNPSETNQSPEPEFQANNNEDPNEEFLVVNDENASFEEMLLAAEEAEEKNLQADEKEETQEEDFSEELNQEETSAVIEESLDPEDLTTTNETEQTDPTETSENISESEPEELETEEILDSQNIEQETEALEQEAAQEEPTPETQEQTEPETILHESSEIDQTEEIALETEEVILPEEEQPKDYSEEIITNTVEPLEVSSETSLEESQAQEYLSYTEANDYIIQNLPEVFPETYSFEINLTLPTENLEGLAYPIDFDPSVLFPETGTEMNYISGDEQTGLMLSQLREELVVEIAGSSGGEEILFEIIEMPSEPDPTGYEFLAGVNGTDHTWITTDTMSVFTDSSGKAGVGFRMGDRAGDYFIRASYDDGSFLHSYTFWIYEPQQLEVIMDKKNLVIDYIPMITEENGGVSNDIYVLTNALSYNLYLKPQDWLKTESHPYVVGNWSDDFGLGWSGIDEIINPFIAVGDDPRDTLIYSCQTSETEKCNEYKDVPLKFHLGLDFSVPAGTYEAPIDFYIDNVEF